jgi:hypothetical protein
MFPRRVTAVAENDLALAVYQRQRQSDGRRLLIGHRLDPRIRGWVLNELGFNTLPAAMRLRIIS